jgi:peptidoglycan/xylan/chitin deacetylase (PgdA/CDA1 family)
VPEFPGDRPGEPEREFPLEEAGRHPSIEEPVGDVPGLLLAFDDDYEEVWERYFDLLDRYGARVTFFVQGDYVPFCAAAVKRGHEIGYHTKSHANLLKVSRQVFFEETIGGAEAFRRQGLPLKSFAYPYGFSEPWMDEALGESFSIRRGFGAACWIYSVDTIKTGYISSKSIDNILYKSDAEFEADINAMLMAVKSGGGILPLTTHTIAAEADWGISPNRLEYLLKTAAEMGLHFYRYGDFF